MRVSIMQPLDYDYQQAEEAEYDDDDSWTNSNQDVKKLWWWSFTLFFIFALIDILTSSSSLPGSDSHSLIHQMILEMHQQRKCYTNNHKNFSFKTCCFLIILLLSSEACIVASWSHWHLTRLVQVCRPWSSLLHILTFNPGTTGENDKSQVTCWRLDNENDCRWFITTWSLTQH